MRRIGTPEFDKYNTLLRRIFWSEFIDAQIRAEQAARFRPTLVDAPLPDRLNLAPHFEYHRHRVAE